MHSDELLPVLRACGLIHDGEVHTKALAGGVSGDIFLVEQDGREFVVKQALAKLRVQDDWFADVSRNRHEQAYLEYVGGFLPDAVPRVLYRNDEHSFFVMEYLGEGFLNWKALLMQGAADPAQARQAGRILGAIHHHSWDDATARERFSTLRNFHELRVDPYLLTTAARHPGLRRQFEEEAARLERTALCLVHGDFSPKNILIHQERMVVLDCEVAWFGDPAFDAAFLLSHLFLKSLFHAPRSAPFLALVPEFWTAYESEAGQSRAQEMEPHVTRLLLMLLLARVDGKSPVEYLTDERKKGFIREFVHAQLSAGELTLCQLRGVWSEALAATLFDHPNEHTPLSAPG